MKQKFTPLKTFAVILGLFLSAFHSEVYSQPDFNFRNPVLLSGTNLQQNARYRFSNVRTGVDAILTITRITSGITVTELDGSGGYAEALQPTLRANSNTSGYLEMRIDFVTAGTTNAMIQAQVSPTCIDVDGNRTFGGAGRGVYEFDEIDLGGGFVNYDLLGNELQISRSGDWFRGYNTAGNDYPGRDTVAKQVMFTVTNYNISSALIRVGVDNRANASVTRERSVYFKAFHYANGLLPLFGLLDFTGTSRDGRNDLAWKLAAECSFTAATVERSVDGRNFEAIHSSRITYSPTAQKMEYSDAFEGEGKVFYRLKMDYPNGRFNYSDILILNARASASSGFRVYPNLVESGASISIHNSSKQTADISLVDLGGRVLSRQQVTLMPGQNSIQVEGIDRLRSGMYLVAMNVGQEKMVQRIIKR